MEKISFESDFVKDLNNIKSIFRNKIDEILDNYIICNNHILCVGAEEISLKLITNPNILAISDDSPIIITRAKFYFEDDNIFFLDSEEKFPLEKLFKNTVVKEMFEETTNTFNSKEFYLQRSLYTISVNVSSEDYKMNFLTLADKVFSGSKYAIELDLAEKNEIKEISIGNIYEEINQKNIFIVKYKTHLEGFSF